MHAADTNVLVRLIARDDARQAAAADSFVAKGAWVSLLALAETVWVLGAV
jgi:predicted nucleic-acid-binding protein